MVCLSLYDYPSRAAGTKVRVIQTEYSLIQKSMPSYPGLWWSEGLWTAYSFVCLSFSILLDAILTSSNVMFSLFVCVFADCCQAKDQYIEQFKDTLNTSVAKSIAGFFVEPIQVGILA